MRCREKSKKGFNGGSKYLAIEPPNGTMSAVTFRTDMSADVTEFRTRKGHRVYKRSRVLGGETAYAPHYTIRVKQDGQTAYFNLGTSKRDAGSSADEIMAFLAVDGNGLKEAQARYSEPHKNRALRDAKAPKIDEASVTVGMIIERYRGATSHLRASTCKCNCQALRHFAGGILQLPKMGPRKTKVQLTEWLTKVDALPLSQLTVQNLEAYRQRELKLCGGDFKKIGGTSTTLNFYLRAARSVFSVKLLPHYSDLNLPDPLPFRGIPPLPEPSHRYHSKINVEGLIQEAKLSLYPNDKDAWIAFLLSFGVGLRREEMDKLMIEQVKLDQGRVWIHTTEFFSPKAKNSEAYVDFSPSIGGYLREYLESIGKRRFVLPGNDTGKGLRSLKVFENLMKWLRANGVVEQKPIHTLRKEAGSLVFQNGGSIERAAQFLRNDPATAREHYVGRKERIELKLPGL